MALSALSNTKRNQVLKAMAAQLLSDEKSLIRENNKDLIQGQKMGLSTAMIGRLTLNPKKIKGMAVGLKQIAALEDPLNRLLAKTKRPTPSVYGGLFREILLFSERSQLSYHFTAERKA